jgi:N-glycosylase/DNA lyase
MLWEDIYKRIPFPPVHDVKYQMYADAEEYWENFYVYHPQQEFSEVEAVRILKEIEHDVAYKFRLHQQDLDREQLNKDFPWLESYLRALDRR